MQEEQMEYPQGMKWTKQRKCVYEVLFRAKEPLSAIQIYNDIIKNMARETAGEQTESSCPSNYAVSTIYRILTAFEEKDLVTKSNWMDSGTFVYRLNRGEHTHYAVCLICHKHIPLQACPFRHVHLPDTEEDFQVTGHKLELYGYCRECRNGM